MSMRASVRRFVSAATGKPGIWAIASVLSQSLTIVLLKSGAQQCGKAFCVAQVPIYAIAASFIAFRVVTWNMALRRGRLSGIYVYTALNPVVLLALSVAFLRESVSIWAIVGACMISLAIYLHQDGRP
jgi:drug/metabolite transporter (DMT)-like permease